MGWKRKINQPEYKWSEVCMKRVKILVCGFSLAIALVVFLFCHGQYFIVAQLHISEADKDTVGHSTTPHVLIRKRKKTDLIQIRLHVQQKPASRYKIDL